MATASSEPGAIVTGASGGIGRAVSEALAEAGWGLVLAGRNAEALRAMRDDLRTSGHRVETVVVDVRDVDAGDRLVDACASSVGPIGALVNNAGVEVHGSFLDSTPEDWQRVVDTNARAPYFIAQRVAMHMVREGVAGRIINVGSVVGMRPEAGWGAYCISKSALIAATRVMAIELAPFNITVNVVNPGLIETPMSEYATTDPSVVAGYLRQIPAGSIGRPEDVAAAVSFLASDAAHYVTGASLEVDGGLSAQLWQTELRLPMPVPDPGSRD